LKEAQEAANGQELSDNQIKKLRGDVYREVDDAIEAKKEAMRKEIIDDRAASNKPALSKDELEIEVNSNILKDGKEVLVDNKVKGWEEVQKTTLTPDQKEYDGIRKLYAKEVDDELKVDYDRMNAYKTLKTSLSKKNHEYMPTHDDIKHFFDIASKKKGLDNITAGDIKTDPYYG
jgi:hypothetical protein